MPGEATRFKKGQRANPNGRPKGARNRFSKRGYTAALKAEVLALLKELKRDWPNCDTPEKIAQVYGPEEGRLARRVDECIQGVEALECPS